MVHKHLDFLFLEDVLELFESFHNAWEFLLCHFVIYLRFW